MELDRLFTPLRLRASGVHGAEMRFAPDGTIETAPEAELPRGVVDGLDALAAQHPGTLVENKRYSAAIHYRAVPEAGPAIAQALSGLIDEIGEDDLRVLPGHMVFEVKRAGFDKGVALARFLERAPFAGRLPMFLGDDVTDEPGFAAVAARGGIAVAVGGARRGASRQLASPNEVRAWLTRMAAEARNPGDGTAAPILHRNGNQ